MNWKEHDHHQQFKQHTGSFPAPHRAPPAPCPASLRSAGPHTPAARRLAREGVEESPGWGREGAEEGRRGRGLPPKDRGSRRRRRLRAGLSSRLCLHRGRPVVDSLSSATRPAPTDPAGAPRGAQSRDAAAPGGCLAACSAPPSPGWRPAEPYAPPAPRRR